MPNPQYKTQMESSRSPLLSTSNLTTSGLALQAAFLLASSATAETAKTTAANKKFSQAKPKP